MARRAVQQLDPELIERGREWKRQSLRYLFLYGIQQMHPDFWRTLNQAWRQHGSNALRHWPPGLFVCDPWFWQVIVDTLTHWAACPDSPEARLESGGTCACFQFRPSCQIPEFAPFPVRDIVPRVLTELPATSEFLGQKDAEFRAYKEAYRSFCRELKTAPVVRSLDAQFTILRWAGFSVGEIRDRWLRSSPRVMRKYQNPERTIKKAVARFSADIGLTLPRIPHRGNL